MPFCFYLWWIMILFAFLIYENIHSAPCYYLTAACCCITSWGKVSASNQLGFKDWTFYKTLGNENFDRFLLFLFMPFKIVYFFTFSYSIFFFAQVVSGGVASNKYVRARLDYVVNKNNLKLVCPPPSLCTDNGNSNDHWFWKHRFWIFCTIDFQV